MPSATAGHAPDLEKFLKSLKSQSLEAAIERLVSLLKRRQIRGSEPCAIATAHILLQVVARAKWQDADTLLEKICVTGRRLVEAQPTELSIANIIRRVLALIRDEAAEDRNERLSEAPSEPPMTPIDATVPSQSWSPPRTAGARQDSAAELASPPPSRAGLFTSYSSTSLPRTLFHLLSASPPSDVFVSMPSSFRNSGTSTPTGRGPQANSQEQTLRSEVIDGIEEILDEISQVDDQIAAQAELQIHPGDHVLVHRLSSTVERFILRAALKRRFTVLLAAKPPRPALPDQSVSAFQKKLSAAGVTTIVLRSATLTAYMPRVDKMILGVRAILSNGGVVADSGAATVARAAKEAGSAVVVLAGLYKLSPDQPFDEDSLIEWASPSTFVGFDDGPLVEDIEVRTAATELVPPELIDMYMTNLWVLTAVRG
ncbi:hypothetical protein CDD80_4265 [Ophiocordyceps camponoti-rufipedis]|uniref:Translation initiation factor eIF2B subunit beta n=1 Tax=Ophiocordyceps camponoti-rufipedis TaxID=2004952 RepID=A0A2C5Y3V3_9HYPO|nr:hypothetical protein CDD80_4265 [Ophiocordyceps camponoti-rufipedis]